MTDSPASPDTAQNPWKLTARQIEVARAVVQHNSRKRVARVLDISTETVADHMKALYKHLRVDNVVALAIKFDRWDRGQS